MDTKFHIGDTAYYKDLDETKETENYYCPECNGRGKITQEFPQYDIKEEINCPLCLGRTGTYKNDMDKVVRNTYRRNYFIPFYRVKSGKVVEIEIRITKKETFVTYLIQDSSSQKIQWRYTEEDLFTTPEECEKRISDIMQHHRANVYKYIGKKYE